MSLIDLLDPLNTVLPRQLRRKVPKLVILAKDDVAEDKGRELQARKLAKKRREQVVNERAHASRKADPERAAARAAYMRAWFKANPERVRAYQEKYRKSETCRRYQREWARRKRATTRKGHPRGENVLSSKLDAARVTEIRTLYAAGGWSFARLGAKFGTGPSAIRKIVKRETWRHVE